MLKLILLPKEDGTTLGDIYKRAFESAEELYILSAYLTSWTPQATLNAGCRTFRLIIGQDYGITRKQACQEVLGWLPRSKKNCFLVAAGIDGFHPKAMFWKEKDGALYALVGSSNLTDAAFQSNHEANGYQQVTAAQFERVRAWVNRIEGESVSVGGGWLETYREAKLRGGKGSSRKSAAQKSADQLQLPSEAGIAEILRHRRKQMVNFAKHRAQLMKLFRDCARSSVTNEEFYAELPKYWSFELNDRFQGEGWERLGKKSDFRQLSRAFMRIVDAKPSERDDEVARQLDGLLDANNPARRAFLSEMLRQRFPRLYPVLNKPVQQFLTTIKFKALRGASEGAKYVDLARRLRFTLRANPEYPAKNLAELDAVIWQKYH